MKPVLNTVPKHPMFLCEMRINKSCERVCTSDAGDPHIHNNDKEGRFCCRITHDDVWCRRI